MEITRALVTGQMGHQNAIFLMDFSPQITLASIGIDLLGTSHTDFQPAAVQQAAQFLDRGTHKDLKTYER
jgi:hypothetical protein